MKSSLSEDNPNKSCIYYDASQTIKLGTLLPQNRCIIDNNSKLMFTFNKGRLTSIGHNNRDLIVLDDGLVVSTQLRLSDGSIIDVPSYVIGFIENYKSFLSTLDEAEKPDEAFDISYIGRHYSSFQGSSICPEDPLAYKKCSHCYTNNNVKNNYCSHCGYPLVNEIPFPKWDSDRDELKDVFIQIIKSRNEDLFLNDHVLNALLADLTPQNNKSLVIVRNAINMGAGKVFHKNLIEHKTPSDIGIRRFKSYLADSGFGVSASELITYLFTSAINIPYSDHNYSMESDTTEKITSSLSSAPIDSTYLNGNVSLSYGDIFSFGEYRGYPIQWKVLSVNNVEAIVISKEIIAFREFDSNSNLWQKSDIRNYLNGYFYNQAFSNKEKSVIIESTDSELSDKVFLLSFDDAYNYFSFEIERQCNDKKTKTTKAWWLRSKSNMGSYVQYIDSKGYVQESGETVCAKLGVRPAMRLMINRVFKSS